MSKFRYWKAGAAMPGLRFMEWTHRRLHPDLHKKRVIIVSSCEMVPLYAELPSNVTAKRAVKDLFMDHPDLIRSRFLSVEVIEKFIG